MSVTISIGAKTSMNAYNRDAHMHIYLQKTLQLRNLCIIFANHRPLQHISNNITFTTQNNKIVYFTLPICTHCRAERIWMLRYDAGKQGRGLPIAVSSCLT